MTVDVSIAVVNFNASTYLEAFLGSLFGSATDGLDVEVGQVPLGRVVAVGRQTDLLEVVRAADPGGGLADLLDRGQQQSDQDGSDGDHDQQLDERKRPSLPTRSR